MDYLGAQPALVPAWLLGVHDHQALVCGQDELVSALEHWVAGREDVISAMVVPLDVVCRLQESMRLLVQLVGAHGKVLLLLLLLLLLEAAGTVGRLEVLAVLVVALLGGQQLVQVLRLLDKAVEAAGQVHTLAPSDVNVLVFGERVAQIGRL